MKVVFIGPLWYGGTTLQRMQTMQDLGYEVMSVDTEPQYVQNKQRQFFYRVMRKLFGPLDLAGVNHDIIPTVKNHAVNVLWIEGGVTISAKTLKTVRILSPKTIIAGYCPDDMAAKHNQSRAFLNGLPLYHIYFTTKSYGVKELKALGAQQVFFIGNAYDPNTHRPVTLSEEEKKQYGEKVGFIGDYELERAQFIFYLAQQGVPVRVWGANWNKKCKLNHPNMKIEGRPLWGDEYAKAICAFDINLAFLRKINRDLQTQRSVEIPACEGFMLAERTNEHMELFEEGKEAEFFGTKEELLEKVRYYLDHEDERKRIARAGRERCLKSGYSYHERIKEMFRVIDELKSSL